MRIYCLGDSLTTGYGVLGHECWVQRVAAHTELKMINAGVNGDVTLGMFARFCRDLETLSPDLVFLLGGGNDILNENTDEHSKKGILAILDRAQACSIPVMLGVPYPFVPDMAERLWSLEKDYDRVNKIQEGYVQWLLETAEEHSLPTVNLWKFFSEMDISQRRVLSLDGIHLKADGHRLVAELIAGVLTKFINDTLKSLFRIK